MAASINVEHADLVKRQDTFKVVPSDIKRGINSRNPDGNSEAADYAETVKARAIDIAINGQLQPCEARREDDNSLTLTFGFTRADAVELLRKGFDAVDPRTGRSVTFHNPEALLWIKVVDVDEKTAFLRGVRENKERKEVTDYQEAKQHQFLREHFGLTDADIAREYGYNNQNRVANLRSVLNAPATIVERVKNGTLAVSVVVNELKGVDPEKAEAVLKDIETSPDGKIGGRINGAAVRAKVRQAQSTDGAFNLVTGEPEAEETEKTEKTERAEGAKSLKRTRKELLDFFLEVADETTVADEGVKSLFAALTEYAAGQCSDRKLWKRIAELKTKGSR